MMPALLCVDDQASGFQRVAGNELVLHGAIKGWADDVVDFQDGLPVIVLVAQFVKPHLNVCRADFSNRQMSQTTQDVLLDDALAVLNGQGLLSAFVCIHKVDQIATEEGERLRSRAPAPGGDDHARLDFLLQIDVKKLTHCCIRFVMRIRWYASLSLKAYGSRCRRRCLTFGQGTQKRRSRNKSDKKHLHHSASAAEDEP